LIAQGPDMSNSKSSVLRKRQLTADGPAGASVAGELDIVSCATIAFTSENPAHPVEHLLDGSSGPGATRWTGARADTIEEILVEFDQPQILSRLVYEVEEATRERTQEVRVEVSADGGRTYRQILVQEYNFSPSGSHLSAPRTAAQSPSGEPSPSHDCPKQERLRHGDAHLTPSLRLGLHCL
jgi:hypothetical protein